MLTPECESLFLKIKATAHALDKLIIDDTSCASEDVNSLSMMLVELVDAYDEARPK